MTTNLHGPRRLAGLIVIVALGLTALSCGSSEPEQAAEDSSGSTVEPSRTSADAPADAPDENPADEPPPQPAETTPPPEPAPVDKDAATAPTPAAETPRTETPPEPKASAGGSGVSGTVKFTGPRPRRTAVRMGADPKCSEAHSARGVGSEQEIVAADGAVANVFVYVTAGLEGRKHAAPSRAAVLNQKGCMYAPHVMGMMVGQKLNIVNSDETMHNVHALARTNREFNNSQPVPGTLTKTFRRVEAPIKFKCDVHPWMSAYVFVLDHPYFAVTNRGGAYSIPDLPPGQFTLKFVHETYGEREEEITVPASGGLSVDLAFEP